MNTIQSSKRINQITPKKVSISNKSLRFMDFCAGIGAGRLGLQNLGMECVAFSEIDKNTEKTYRLFFGEKEKNYGDLMKINAGSLPDFDVMIAGFPCQTFSMAGQRKGMNDKRGQIIYGLVKILKEKRIKYFIFENVKGLVSHDSGNSLKTILNILSDAGYNVTYKVLNSVDYNSPQHRERIYLIGVRKDIKIESFKFPEPQKTPDIAKYLIEEDSKYVFDEKHVTFKTFNKYLSNKYNNGQYRLKDLLKNDFDVIDTRQSDLRIYKGRTPTLRTGRHGILYVKDKKLRRLSGYEALLLQGFPRNYANKTKGVIKDTHLLSQAGNAMTVTTIEKIGAKLLKYINQTDEK